MFPAQMTRLLLLISTVFLLTSCAGDRVMRSQDSQVVFSPNFNYVHGRVVALLPFTNAGRSGFNYSVTERFGANLLRTGFSVIDRAQVEQAAANAGIDLSQIPTRSQLAELGKVLNVDTIVAGSCIYHQGASAESEEAIYMISARFIDAASGEILIHATTQPDGIIPVTRSMASSIRNNILNDLFRKGNLSYEKKNYADALASYSKLIDLEPSLIEAYRNRGAALSKTGDNNKALADYDLAIALFESKYPPPASQPQKWELFVNRGIVLVKAGKAAAAIADFNMALEYGGDPAAIHANLGYARFRMNELDNSLMEYDQAIQADPDRAGLYYQRGLVFEEVSLPDAVKDFSRAIILDGRFAAALAARGRANLRLGYKNDAIRDYSLALELEPGNEEYLTARAALFCQAGERDKAIKDYSSAIEANPTNFESYLGRGICHAANGDAARAGEDFGQVLKSGSPLSTAAYLEAGILKEKQGSYREAIDDFSRAIESSGKDASGYSSRGKTLERMGNYRDSTLDFSRSLELRADNPEDLFNRGYSRMQTGSYRQAIEDFSMVATLDPDHAGTFRNRGYAYQQTGNYSQAISDYSRALALQPEKVESSYRRRYPDAQLNKLVEAYHPFFIYYNRGLSYLASGNYRPAIADFNKAIELDAGSAEAFFRRGMANQQAGEMERALADYDRALELDSRLADAYYGRGSWREQSGKFSSAITDYTTAIDIMPDFAQAYFSRGLLRMQMSLEETGMTDIKAAARMNLKQARDYLLTRGAEW